MSYHIPGERVRPSACLPDTLPRHLPWARGFLGARDSGSQVKAVRWVEKVLLTVLFDCSVFLFQLNLAGRSTLTAVTSGTLL